MSSALSDTLGIRPGARIAVVEPPPGLAEALEPLPTGVELLTEAEIGLERAKTSPLESPLS